MVAGDALVGERFQQIREAVLCREQDPVRLCREVREMREKMRSSLDRSTSDRFDLKQGSGGIADIEFMVQYLVLRWAQECPALLRWTDNIRFLATLGENRLLPSEVAERLSDSYRALRAAHHRNVLGELPGLIPQDHLREARQLVKTQWDIIMCSGGA